MLFLLFFGCNSDPSPVHPSVPQSPESETQSLQTKQVTSTSTPRETVYSTKNLASLSLPVTKEYRFDTPIAFNDMHTASKNALKGMIKQHGILMDNPWALLHAFLALGPEIQLPTGEKALDRLFQEYAILQKHDNQQFVDFPMQKEVDGTRILIEPHTDLALKVLTEIGVPADYPVTVQGQQKQFLDLYKNSLLQTHLEPQKNLSSFQSPNDIPWSLQGLSAMAPTDLRWESNRLQMDLHSLTVFTAAVVHQETRFLAQAYQNQAGFEKKKQGIFKYTCGGAHLIQGLAYANARGFGGEKSTAVVQEQIPLLYYRFPIELQIYDALMQKYP
ncbi:MAG: hypothetical protein VX278_07155, partial [Myxococcota bacterium]|nr:hypothetical protein [Myxococcota bacterium]